MFEMLYNIIANIFYGVIAIFFILLTISIIIKIIKPVYEFLEEGKKYFINKNKKYDSKCEIKK